MDTVERVLLRVCLLVREEASGAERFWGTTTGGVGVREMRMLVGGHRGAEAGFGGADVEVDVDARGVGEREGADDDDGAGGRGRVDKGDGLGEGTSGRDVDGAGLGEGTLRAERERRDVLGERVFLFTLSIPLQTHRERDTMRTWILQGRARGRSGTPSRRV